MTIYKVTAASNNKYDGDLVYSQELSISNNPCHFNGLPAKNWEPIEFSWCTEEHLKSELTINDFVLVTGAGVFIALNEKAKNIIEPILGNDAQFLEISIVGEESTNWYLINIINRIDDAVSKEKSTYRVRRDGSKGGIRQVVFDEKNIPNNRVFVFPESPSRMMVKGNFLKELIEKHGLTGLTFDTYQISTAEAS